MKRSSGPRKTANLSESTHQQLTMYALAAGAAGVGVLAMAQPAEAKIVYTPAHIRITGTFSLDLNHDGVTDFKIRVHQYSHSPFSTFWSMRVSSKSYANQIVCHSSHGSSGFANALPAGSRLGPKRRWERADAIMVGWGTNLHGGTSHSGAWFDVQRRYLGLKFIIHGNFHHGWARFNVNMSNNHFDAVLTGYAYETIANKAIVTGQTKGPDDASVEEPNTTSTVRTQKPATLAALALGSPGVSIWRREEQASATP